MSASSKKKLRKEQSAAQMTERQLAEQKEAKKLKLYTIAFVVVLVALLVVAITVGISQTVSNSGMRERSTTAVTIGNHEISNAELSYYYIDTVQNFYSSNGSYASLLGLDVTAPLNEQIMDESTGDTWADYFLAAAKDTARNVYTLSDAAAAAGYTLSDSDKTTVENILANMELYATLYGYTDTETYLKAMYGNGATVEDYTAYLEQSLLADSYYVAYGDSLVYTDDQLREKEADNYNAYSSFTYSYYYLSASRFLEGGTTDEEGNTTYSDEETAASIAAAEEVAKTLVAENITSEEALDEAIANLTINEGSEVYSTLYEDYSYSRINSVIAEWLAENGRKEGDKTYIANVTTADDGTETISGYYVIYFHSSSDNKIPMANVRHILAAFEGGTTDETTGETVYTDEEKAAAKAEAEEILNEWKSGEATEDSFAALANEKSDDGDGTTGGLYENIVPASSYVENFENWALADHNPGDVEIVETEYGYHIMYYVGTSELNYRDYMIESELRSADVSDWHTGLLENYTITEGDTSYISKDLVLSAG